MDHLQAPAGASSSTPLPERLQAGPPPPHLLSHSVPSLGPGRSALKPFARPKEQNCRPRWFSFVSARLSIRFLLCICFMLQTLVCTCRDSAGGRFSRFQQRWVGGSDAVIHACHTQLDIRNCHTCVYAKFKHLVMFNHRKIWKNTPTHIL